MKRVVLVIGIASSVILGFALGGFLGYAAMTTATKPTETITAPYIDATPLFAQVNVERAKVGITPLTRDKRLDVSAATKCQDMLKDHYYDHKDENGEVWNFIRAVLPSYKLAGENIGVTDQSAQHILTGWMDSPTHKKNILDKEFVISGIATCTSPAYIVQGHKNLTLVVQHFATE